ncbi:MAG: XrtA/PEP-CTERM system histidine kinase PrsK [Sedimenticola sp.]
MNLGALSYLFAFFSFLALSTLLALSWRKHAVSSLTILASISTTIWAGVSASSMYLGVPTFDFVYVAELARDASWCFFLLSILNTGKGGDERVCWAFYFTVFLTVVSSLVVIEPLISDFVTIPGFSRSDSLLFTWIIFSITGLFLVEQLFRNATKGNRWAIKHIGFGLGGLFAYDFFMFSDAMLFKHLNEHLWNARGLVNGFLVPLIAISIARNPKWKLDIHVSRQVVFHSTTFIGAGIYLLLMAGVGYYIRSYGGQWGITLQIVFLCGAIILLFVLLFSGRIRAQIRVLLSKHFFSYKYDYREEWLKFSNTLSASEEEVPDRVIHAIAALVNSKGGTLWVDKNNHYELLGRWHAPEPPSKIIKTGSKFKKYCEKKQWILDLQELRDDPEMYEELRLPEDLAHQQEAWLLIPLFTKESLQGFILLLKSEIQKSINWEDRDLLKTAAQQATIYLVQYQADRELMEARQFEAFHRLSAYVVHDLKNILAQQSLLLTNAEKHKHNPQFIDDVFKTIRSSVGRMSRLMAQMQSGIRGNNPSEIDLAELLKGVIGRYSSKQPIPHADLPDHNVPISADHEQLSTVFGHLIQNAQEATGKDGNVWVRLTQESGQAIIEVEDDGHGMDERFIRERLFKPFDSTKGLTGMGIGVFESRELIRALGGDISVKSSPGEGTLFQIQLPTIDNK